MDAAKPVPGEPSTLEGLPGEEKFRSFDGVTLQVWRWPAQGTSQGTLMISHGLGEHGRRYDHIAAAAADQGWNVLYWDQRGHGRSEGKRGHVERFRDYVEDVHHLRTALAKDDKVVLLGHSLGGLIAARTLFVYPDDFQRAVLSGPALGIKAPIPALKAVAGKLLSKIVPSLTMANEIDPRLICSDTSIVARYQQDSLVHDRVSTRWFTEFLSTIEYVQSHAADLRVPTAIWCGEKDALVSQEACRKFAVTAKLPDPGYTELPGLFHEILNEPNWADTWADMADFLGR